MIRIAFRKMTRSVTLNPQLLSLSILMIGCFLLPYFSLNCASFCFIFLKMEVDCLMSFVYFETHCLMDIGLFLMLPFFQANAWEKCIYLGFNLLCTVMPTNSAHLCVWYISLIWQRLEFLACVGSLGTWSCVYPSCWLVVYSSPWEKHDITDLFWTNKFI